MQGGYRSFLLQGKTNTVNLPHIRIQTLYSLKRILDNGLSLGIHFISFMSPPGALKANSNYIQGRTNFADSVNSAAFLSDPRGSPIYVLFISKLSST